MFGKKTQYKVRAWIKQDGTESVHYVHTFPKQEEANTKADALRREWRELIARGDFDVEVIPVRE